MSMEITGINLGTGLPGTGRERTRAVQAEQIRNSESGRNTSQQTHIEPLEHSLRELEELSRVFNRRLKLVVNNELDRVIVKVIDRETDTVIKELPSQELQRVYSRIREALGLLIDREI